MALKSLARMQQRRHLQAAQQVLKAASGRLRKDRRHWPFTSNEWDTVSTAIEDAARRRLGDVEVSRIEGEIARVQAAGGFAKVKTMADLDALAQPTLQRVTKAVIEDRATKMVGELRKGGRR